MEIVQIDQRIEKSGRAPHAFPAIHTYIPQSSVKVRCAIFLFTSIFTLTHFPAITGTIYFRRGYQGLSSLIDLRCRAWLYHSHGLGTGWNLSDSRRLSLPFCVSRRFVSILNTYRSTVYRLKEFTVASIMVQILGAVIAYSTYLLMQAIIDIIKTNPWK
jgi:hypothetical protein